MDKIRRGSDLVLTKGDSLHVLDLNIVIEKLFSLLERNGYLFVEVLNTEQNYWNQDVIDMPHIHFFMLKSLKLLFQKHGFKTVKVFNYGSSYIDDIKNGLEDKDYYTINSNGLWIRALFKKI